MKFTVSAAVAVAALANVASAHCEFPGFPSLINMYENANSSFFIHQTALLGLLPMVSRVVNIKISAKTQTGTLPLILTSPPITICDATLVLAAAVLQLSPSLLGLP